MVRRRRLPSSRASGSGSTLATVAVMTALLVVLLATQRTISNRLGQVFVTVTEGSSTPPPEASPTVRVQIDDPAVARVVARGIVHRSAAGAAAHAAEAR